MQATSTSTGQDERQAVVFVVAGEQYGADVSVVLEIIRMTEITALPAAPAFVRGMINLRGKIIPVVDLRERFGLPPAPATRDSRIVVIEVGSEDVGIIVDSVSEVRRVPAGAIERAPFAPTPEQAAFVEGVANLDGGLIILLNLQAVLAGSRPE